MIRLILAFIGLLAILLTVANVIGGAMWDLADGMDLWWNGEEGGEDDGID